MNDEYEFHLEPFGQQAGLWNLYTHLTFCYSRDEATSKSEIVHVLTRGLEQLIASFPWVAGQVVREDRGKDSPRYYIIRPYESIPRLVVKDLSNELPPFATYEQAGFPINLLDENVIAPRNTKSISDETDPKPVFLLEATFVAGGLLLTFAGQHGTMDIAGQGEIIKLLSKACHRIPFSSEEISLGNRERRTVVSLLSECEIRPFENTETQPKKPDSSQPSSNGSNKDHTPATPPSSPPKNVWANFIFSSASLTTIKTLATQTLPKSTPYISTDDALSAYIWQAISQARLSRLSPSHPSTFARTVDTRPHLSIPSTYPGNMATKVFITNTLQTLTTQSLGQISSQLRQSLTPQPLDLAYQTRLSATVMTHPHPYPILQNQLPQPKSRDLSQDIAFSSWAKIAYCHDLTFNLGLDRPRAVRRPGFAPPGEEPMEGVVYLLPKARDGEVVAVVCLRQEDMARLKGMEGWNGLARFVG